jgi:hypothetical protein
MSVLDSLVIRSRVTALIFITQAYERLNSRSLRGGEVTCPRCVVWLNDMIAAPIAMVTATFKKDIS